MGELAVDPGSVQCSVLPAVLQSLNTGLNILQG